MNPSPQAYALIEQFEGKRPPASLIEPIGEKLSELLTFETTQMQFDALVSLAYAVGLIALSRSDLLRLHNQGHGDAAADEFAKFTPGPGIVRWREAEAEHYRHGT